MLFGEKNKIIFLKRNSIDLLNQTGQVLASCQFPDNVVHNLEIINNQQFEIIIRQLIAQTKIPKAEAVLVIADQLIFFKSYPANTPQSQTLDQNFLNTIPFESIDLTHIHYQTKEWLTYLAINKKAVSSLKNCLQTSNWSIKSVLPAVLLGQINSDGTLSQQILQKISQNGKLAKEYNFLIS